MKQSVARNRGSHPARPPPFWRCNNSHTDKINVLLHIEYSMSDSYIADIYDRPEQEVETVTTIQTGLASSIDASDTRAKFDTLAKRILRHRIILAKILKECVEEFRGYELSFIEQNCFVGEVKVGETSVDQDIPDADFTIVGSNTEDVSDKEGVVRYDLIFDVIVPTTHKMIRLVINIEIQIDTSLPYSIITRAVYYLARLISRQKGTVFNHLDYQKLQKVYSIWICPNPKKGSQNSIAVYGFNQEKVIGVVNEPIENYDKMKAIIISLSDDGTSDKNNIIQLLSTLFSTRLSVVQKKEILGTVFHIPMTREIEEEVTEMCNLGEAIEQMGIEKGMEKGMKQGHESSLLQSIKNLMDSMKWSAQQAMDALKIPKDEQEKYAARL